MLMFLSAGIASQLYNIRMMNAVNLKKKDNEKIPWIGFYPGKFWRVIKEYRYLYPDGHIHIYIWRTFAVSLTCMIGLVVDIWTMR